MRGKEMRLSSGTLYHRITPAYAGKSTSFRQLPCSCQDHPRLCGEKYNSLLQLLKCLGSPPPMRGKVESELEMRKKYGITPAYAGKSSIAGLASTWDKDHPRLCGEKCMTGTSKRLRTGSPPPMRGKVITLSLI